MRPGEKLYEELSTLLEDTAPTAHEKIRIYVGNSMPEGDMVTWLDSLRETSETRDAGRGRFTTEPQRAQSQKTLKRVIEARHRTLPSPRVLCVKPAFPVKSASFMRV